MLSNIDNSSRCCVSICPLPTNDDHMKNHYMSAHNKDQISSISSSVSHLSSRDEIDRNDNYIQNLFVCTCVYTCACVSVCLELAIKISNQPNNEDTTATSEDQTPCCCKMNCGINHDQQQNKKSSITSQLSQLSLPSALIHPDQKDSLTNSRLSYIPPLSSLSDKTFSHLINEYRPYAAANGLTLFSKQKDVMIVPVSLLPTPFPESIYLHIQSLTSVYNRLYDKISRDAEFLLQIHSEIGKVDPFIASLLSILRETRYTNSLSLQINRSDYMLNTFDQDHHTETTPLQVEFNTIAAGAGGLSTKVSEFHRFIIQRYLSNIRVSNLPNNNVIIQLSQSIADAHHLFIKKYSHFINHQSVSILMVVTPHEGNETDQRLLEYQLWNHHNISLTRKTFAELGDPEISCLNVNKLLIVNSEIISLVYFRAGYSPADYHSQLDWTTRLRLEQSLSIKCPSISYHLAGTKRVQQVLSQPGVVEQYISSVDSKLIRSSFTTLWAFDRIDQNVIEKVILHPEEYVLKPQREGGGNNLYDNKLKEYLLSSTFEQLNAWILMKK